MPSKQKILIIDDVHSYLIDSLAADHEVIYQPDIKLEELATTLADINVLVMRSKLNLTAEWIDRAPALKIIGRLGSGMDNIDVDHAIAKGIICLNAPEGNRVSVAEQTIGMMLSVFSNIVCSAREVAHGVWDRRANVGTELSSKTVGIIGYGNTGSALAERLKSFGCKILAYDLYKKGFGEEGVEECSLEHIQENADVISLHIPLNEHSKWLVDRQFIDNMAKPFYLFNLSRGDVIMTKDVVRALKDRKIIGMGLDVFENENLSQHTEEQQLMFNELINDQHVIMTPHIGGLTKESYYKLAVVLSNKIKEKLN